MISKANRLLADPEGASTNWSILGRQHRAPTATESVGSIDGVKRGVLGGDAIGVLPDSCRGRGTGRSRSRWNGDPPPQISLPHHAAAAATRFPLESLMARWVVLDAR